MTERRAAVWLRAARAFWAPGVWSQSLALTKPKGTAVAPHCRANRLSSASFVIGASSLQLAIEVPVDFASQAKSLTAIIDLHAGQRPGIKTQPHFQAAQRQVHFIKVIVEPDGAVFAHHP